MSSFSLLVCVILLFQIACNASRPLNDFKSTEEEIVSFEEEIAGGDFAHGASDFASKPAISPRPTIQQIKTMITRFAPLIYFHPDEEYFPSSVPWFFKNGGQLFDPKPHGITNDGNNLPRNGNLDSAFLDLPSDQHIHDTVKKGSLADAVAYIHAKPVVTGSYTDIVIWLYYPFNGPAKFQLGPFIIPLFKAGQHVSDWEHMRLRIDNLTGSLKQIYLSQHRKGKWLEATEFEYKDGRPVVYASLHNHANYNAPKSYIYYGAQIREVTRAYPRKSMLDSFVVGPVDKAAKGDCVFDILAPSSYEIVALDYGAEYIVPPPWLDYTGRWGPTVFSGWKDMVKAVIGSFSCSWKYKFIAKMIVDKLPNSLFAQEGPAGPKMKPSWPLAYQEQSLEIDVIPLISDLIKAGLPIWLYSGGQDSKIPLTQTRIIANNIADDLKLTTLTDYRTCHNGKQVGGWSQSFGGLKDGKNVTYLTYATVRGAAHEVPFTSPSQALTLFLNGSPLPRPKS
ncbi:vacuolar protein sorting-associated protein 62 [Tanacetum coccineum]